MALRNLRASVEALKHARWSMMGASLACSVAHICGRLMTLPIIITSLGADVPLTSLIVPEAPPPIVVPQPGETK